jgi:hypothetical protein
MGVRHYVWLFTFMVLGIHETKSQSSAMWSCRLPCGTHASLCMSVSGSSGHGGPEKTDLCSGSGAVGQEESEKIEGRSVERREGGR